MDDYVLAIVVFDCALVKVCSHCKYADTLLVDRDEIHIIDKHKTHDLFFPQLETFVPVEHVHISDPGDVKYNHAVNVDVNRLVGHDQLLELMLGIPVDEDIHVVDVQLVLPFDEELGLARVALPDFEEVNA